MRKLAFLYAALVAIVAIWALWINWPLLHSTQEHLLPGIALGLVSLPASLSLGPLYETWPEFFDMPFVQLAWLALCGLGQATILFLLSSLFTARNAGEA